MDSRFPSPRARLLVMSLLLGLMSLLISSPSTAQTTPANVVISQIYGGGGNSGATYTHDFVELFNRGTTSVSLAGWSIQYASASGTTWSKTDLSGSLQPGQYFLIQQAQGSGGTTSLPIPDATGTIAMSASAGKVVLLNSNTTIPSGTSCPTGAAVVDLVGFGGANCFEGSGPTATLNNTTAALRAGSGCTDTTNNSADFSAAAPAPRNTASSLSPCVASTNPTGSGSADPSTVIAGNTTLLTVAVTPGSNPASTGLTVAGDLSGIGGSAAQSFFDDGSNGDLTAGDNIFSYLATVDSGISAGVKSLPITMGDAQGRTGNTTIPVTVQLSAPAGGDIVISQIYGGGGNSGSTYTHDFIELFNRSDAPVNLSGWSVQYASSTGTSWQVTALSGSLAPGKYYLIQQAQGAGGTMSLPAPDAVGTIAMSASAGKVALVSQSTALSGACPTVGIVDFVGFGATANCFEGSGPTPAPSNINAILRQDAGNQDTDDNAADFVTGAPNPRNGQFGEDVAPSVTSTTPANGTADVAADANIIVNFSEAVSATDPWFNILCAGINQPATVSGGPQGFILDPTSDLPAGASCTVTVTAANVTDLDTNDPPDAMTADYSWSFTTVSANACELSFTPIYAIQGSGANTPLDGQIVTTQGVVVGDYEGSSPTLRGFYLQDLAGDSDPLTSDGLFVFNNNNDTVSLGDVVRVTGTVAEFQGQTQLSNVTTILNCGDGSVPPIDITLPLPDANYLERYEGMLVRLPQTLYVTEHFQLGRFGQVVLSVEDRLYQPTNVVEPGAAALALQAANDLRRIIVDDALNSQNPDPILFARNGAPLSASNTLRGGDTATGIVGILTYTWAGNSASGNAYRVRPLNALGGAVEFVAANLRPTAAPAVGGTLNVATMNLLNYFNTFSGCTNGVGGASTDCRGAENQAEFDRQWPKTAAAILAMDADIIGIVEIENDGYGAESAIAHLTQKLNDATAPGTYAFVDVDTNSGQINALGTDAIKVGLLYKPASVVITGTTAVLNSDAFVNGGDPSPRNRATVAQAFAQPDGEIVIVNVNHLKSKGSACEDPDAGDGQGNCNAVRVAAAQELISWLASDPTGTGDPDLMIVGDLNSYALEDPITLLTENGFVNLIAEYGGETAYSYVFDGQWGYLDHMLASPTLAQQITGVGEYHINADEPNVLDYNTNFKSAGQIASLYAANEFRMADHDPLMVGLALDSQTTLTIALDVDPASPRNFRFEGDLGDFKLDGSEDNDPFGRSLTFNVEADTAYTVIEKLPGRWFLTDIVCDSPNVAVDLSGAALTITPAYGEDITCTFVNRLSGALWVNLFDDLNANGMIDKREKGLKGWTLSLYNAAGELIGEEITNGAGKAIFWKVPAGDYTLCQPLPSGWFNSQPGIIDPDFGQPCVDLTILPGQEWLVTFGNHDNPSTIASGSASPPALKSIIVEADDADYEIDARFFEDELNIPLNNEELFLPLIGR